MEPLQKKLVLALRKISRVKNPIENFLIINSLTLEKNSYEL